MTSSTGAVTIRQADPIWREEGGWFDARWHFSFDRYRDPEQMGVGALRVGAPSGDRRIPGFRRRNVTRDLATARLGEQA